MGEPKKQVVICTDGIFPYAVGGMQRHSLLLVQHLAAHPDWEIVVIHPHTETVFPGLPVTEIKIKPIDPAKNYLRESYRYSQRVYEVLQQYPRAVIYAQGLSVWYKAKTLSPRLIVNPHGLEPYQAMGTKDKLIAVPFKFVFNRLFSRAGKVVSLGGNLTWILSRRVPESKIVVLPNGVMPRNVQPKHFDEQPLKMLFVARFAHNKGIHILMQAIDQLQAKGLGNAFEFHLVGKGPLFDFYSKEVKHTSVKLHGFASDQELENMYAQFHGFVFPTLFEGMPTVILEAMAQGMPVMASNTGAVAELVDAGTGWLIERGSVQALVDALEQFKSASISQKQNMSEAAVRKVNARFTWNKVADLHLQVFDNIYHTNLDKNQI